MKKKHDKFNALAEKEVEAALSTITTLSEARLIASSFPKLGIKSKTILAHAEKIIIDNSKEINFNHIETLMIAGINVRAFSKIYYETLASRFAELFGVNKRSVIKSKGQLLIAVLQKWETNGLYKNPELVTRLQDHIQLL
jgi:hypothetical protein